MLDGYVSEKEQLETIKKWWNENGKFIAIAVIVGLVIGFGWRYWHQLEIRRAENASMIYQSVMQADAANNTTTAQGGAKLLIKQFPSSPYASLAAILSAKEFVAENKLPEALSQLQWVISHSNSNRLQQIARIYAARILLAQKNPTAAQKEIAVVDDKSFAGLIALVKGDIDVDEGNMKSAMKNYAIAKNAMDNPHAA